VAKYSSTAPLLTTVSGENGLYEFDISNESAFPSGSYKLHANQNEELEGSLSIKIARQSIPEVVPLGMRRYELSRKAGIIFSSISILFLIGLLVTAFILHKVYPKNHLMFHKELVAQAGDQIDFDHSSEINDVNDTIPSIPFAITPEMASHKILTSLDSMVQDARYDFNVRQKGMMSESVRLALNAGSVKEFKHHLKLLNSTLQTIEGSFKIWSRNPWKFIEIFIWALIATIIRMVIYNGFHIYKNTYRKWAFMQHLAFMICIPIIAVIMTLVFNLLNFEIEGGAFALKVDLGNIYFSIVVAALVGFAPWKSWHYLKYLSDSFFGMLPGLGKSVDSNTENN